MHILCSSTIKSRMFLYILKESYSITISYWAKFIKFAIIYFFNLLLICKLILNTYARNGNFTNVHAIKLSAMFTKALNIHYFGNWKKEPLKSE